MAVPQMQGLDTLYKPWGMTAGGMVGRRETDMEAADLLNLEEGMLGNVVKQVEASRAANDFSDPRMEMLRQQGIMGKDQQSSAAGQLAMGTLQSAIPAGNAKNAAEQSGNEMKSMVNALDNSIAMIQANGPAGMAMAVRSMPPALQQIMQQAGPQAPQVLMKLSEMLKAQIANSPAHMGAMELEDRRSENDFIIKDNSEMEANKRNDADNAARAADRTAQREATQASKDQSDGMRKEQELTRRMEHGRQKLKLLQDEYNQIDEALVTPVFGMTKEEKTVRKGRLEKQKKDIKASAQTLVAEMDRLNSLSSFSSGEGTASKPIKLD